MARKRRPHFTASSKSQEEVKVYFKREPTKFKDVTVVDHDTYVKDLNEKDAILICGSEPTPGLGDNLQGECADCGHPIYYRPYNQAATAKVCLPCGTLRFERDQAKEKKPNVKK